MGVGRTRDQGSRTKDELKDEGPRTKDHGERVKDDAESESRPLPIPEGFEGVVGMAGVVRCRADCLWGDIGHGRASGIILPVLTAISWASLSVCTAKLRTEKRHGNRAGETWKKWLRDQRSQMVRQHLLFHVSLVLSWNTLG